MNGMDVLRRCAAYDGEIKRLAARRYYADEARTRIQAGTSSTGRGVGVSDKIGELTVRVCDCERMMELRRALYTMELAEATRLCGLASTDAGRVLYMRYVEGLTVRQIAGEISRSEDSVRGLRRRGELELENMHSLLEFSQAYIDAKAALAACSGGRSCRP